MQIFIRCNLLLVLDIDPLATIRNLKYTIKQHKHYHLCRFYLVFAGKVLEDQNTLNHYHIHENATIDIRHRGSCRCKQLQFYNMRGEHIGEKVTHADDYETEYEILIPLSDIHPLQRYKLFSYIGYNIDQLRSLIEQTCSVPKNMQGQLVHIQGTYDHNQKVYGKSKFIVKNRMPLVNWGANSQSVPVYDFARVNSLENGSLELIYDPLFINAMYVKHSNGFERFHIQLHDTCNYSGYARDPKNFRCFKCINGTMHLTLNEVNSFPISLAYDELSALTIRTIVDGLTSGIDVTATIQHAQNVGNLKRRQLDQLGRTPFYKACKNGDFKRVKWLYKFGASEDIRTPEDRLGRTPMYISISNGHFDIVQWLFANGAAKDIRTPCSLNCTPMFCACDKGHLTIVKWLNINGAAEDVLVRTNNGWTCMNATCDQGNVEISQWLYDNGASLDVSVPKNDGKTPMFSACYEGNLNSVKWLFDHGCKQDVTIKDDAGRSCTYAAAYEGHLNIVQWLYENGAKEDISQPRNGEPTGLYMNGGPTPLYIACENDHLNIVKFFHSKGLAQDINKNSFNGQSPLRSAATNNNFKVVEWLVHQGTPLPTNISTWFGRLNYSKRMSLFQDGIANRDHDHLSFLSLVIIINRGNRETARDRRNRSRCRTSRPSTIDLLHIDGVLKLIGEFIEGTLKQRSLWYQIVREGPGDEMIGEEEDEEDEEDEDSDDEEEEEEDDEH